MNELLNFMHAIALLEASRDLVGMLRPDTRQRIKSRLSNFDQQFTPVISALKEQVKQSTPKEGHERMMTYIDDIGATSSEVLREYVKARDKKSFLALCMAYNEGEVEVEVTL